MEMPKCKSYTINVTQKIIDDIQTTERHSGKCLAAQATRYSLGAESVTANSLVVKFNLNGFRWTYDIPTWVRLRIESYDDGVKPIPFKFRLRAGYAGLIQDRPKKDKSTTTTTKKKKRKSSPRTCLRRYHGIPVVSNI